MRIAVIGPAAVDDFAWNVADGLTRLGHSPTLVGSAAVAGNSSIAKARRAVTEALTTTVRAARAWDSSRLASRVMDAEPELVITVQSLHPSVVERIRQAGARVVLWFPDAVSNLGDLWMFEAPYSGVFFKEPVLVERVLEVLDLPVHYLPEACNPSIHRRPEVTTKSDHLVVAGNFYPTRMRLLERLADDGIPMRFYGNPLPAGSRLASMHAGEYVRGDRKASVFRNAAAVLNNLHPAEVDGVNCRMFEAAACGATVLCENRAVLRDLFVPGEEVLPFEDYEGLLSQARRLVSDPGSGTSIGDRAAERAAADHTYEIRLAQMLSLI